MPTTIATIRGRVRQDLHDEDSSAYRWTDAVLDRHISRAVTEYSQYTPLEQKSVLTTTMGSRDLSIASFTSVVTIDALEWPTGQFPPRYVPFSQWQGILTMDIQNAPSGVEDVNVYWTKVHTLDASSSTIPAAHEDVIALGAAAYAALDWTSFATNRINTGGEDVWGRYKAFGESRLRDFNRAMGRIGHQGLVRMRRLYSTDAPAPRRQDRAYGP
ncbi:MAG: hypothetical protein HY873_08910 [Chloroflexi bacterium]|nr:hypothetical protein [Chloroflexota bacterium]